MPKPARRPRTRRDLAALRKLTIAQLTGYLDEYDPSDPDSVPFLVSDAVATAAQAVVGLVVADGTDRADTIAQLAPWLARGELHEALVDGGDDTRLEASHPANLLCFDGVEADPRLCEAQALALVQGRWDAILWVATELLARNAADDLIGTGVDLAADAGLTAGSPTGGLLVAACTELAGGWIAPITPGWPDPREVPIAAIVDQVLAGVAASTDEGEALFAAMADRAGMTPEAALVSAVEAALTEN